MTTTPRETADHAELAEAHYIDLFRTIREAGRSDSEKANAASKYLASILLSEIAALRVRAEEADALASKHFLALREKQDDAAVLKHGKLEAERQRDEEIAVHTRIAAEVIEARRQRDEAVGHLKAMSHVAPRSFEVKAALAFLASQGADQ